MLQLPRTTSLLAMPDGLTAGRDSVFLEAPEADGKGVEGSAEGLPRADCRPDGFAPLSSEPVDDPNFQLLRGARALVGPRLFSWGCNMHLVQSLVLTQIRPNPRNARTHSKKQIAQIAGVCWLGAGIVVIALMKLAGRKPEPLL